LKIVSGIKIQIENIDKKSPGRPIKIDFRKEMLLPELRVNYEELHKKTELPKSQTFLSSCFVADPISSIFKSSQFVTLSFVSTLQNMHS
jgi:hypothetical protein